MKGTKNSLYWQLHRQECAFHELKIQALDNAVDRLAILSTLEEPWSSRLSVRVDGDGELRCVLMVDTPAEASPLIEWLEKRFGEFTACSRTATSLIYTKATRLPITLILAPIECERVEVGTEPVYEVRCAGWEETG